MRALLLTVGSRGDVQPFVALGARLRDDGHEAVLAAPAVFGGLAAAHGLPFLPLDLDMDQVGADLGGRYGLRHLVRFCRAMGRRTAGVLPGVSEAAGLGADLVVHHPLLPLGQHLAEFLGIPAVVALPMPALVPTAAFLSPAWPLRLPDALGALNRHSFRAARLLTGAWCRPPIESWRREVLGLPPRRGMHDPLLAPDGAPATVLHAFSPAVLPRPADWPASAHVTGYWQLPAPSGTWDPPRRLAEFLAADGPGKPIVYIGFGSMPIADPVGLGEAIKAGAARAVVGSLRPELRRVLPPDRFMVIRNVPHGWLFPRVHAVVHHGGAGTTGAAVAAGRPQVIWPFGIDQQFWADRMASLGVAPSVPRARPARDLTGRTLAAALDAALGDQNLADRAGRLGRRVRAEDGLGRAVELLERTAGLSRTAVRA